MPLVVRVGACECVVCSEVIIDGTTTLLPGAGGLMDGTTTTPH